MENSRQNTRFKWRNAKALEAAVEKGNIKSDGSLNSTSIYKHTILNDNLVSKNQAVVVYNTSAEELTTNQLVYSGNNPFISKYLILNNGSDTATENPIFSITKPENKIICAVYTSSLLTGWEIGETITDTVTKL